MNIILKYKLNIILEYKLNNILEIFTIYFIRLLTKNYILVSIIMNKHQIDN